MMVVVKVVMIVVEMGAGWVKWVDGLCGSGGGWRGGRLWMVGCGVLGVGGGGVGCWGWGDCWWGVVGGGGGWGWWGGGLWMVGCGVLGVGGGGVGCWGWGDRCWGVVGGGCWRVVGQGHFFPLLSCQAAFQQPKIRTKKYEFVLLKFVFFCTNPFYKGL